jgi:SAM-dependent methyltransferase
MRRADAAFDRTYGTDTSDLLEIADMHDVVSPHRERGIRYEPTLAEPFRRVMRAASVPARGTFLDVGSGKGRALMLAVEYGFRSVVGVDFSASLCEIARRNLERYARRSETLSWEIVCDDAAGYRVGDDVSVVYVYNPFDEVVMRAFLDGLDASLAAAPRPLWLIYHNPVWHELVAARGFDVVLERSYGARDFTVYRRVQAP